MINPQFRYRADSCSGKRQNSEARQYSSISNKAVTMHPRALFSVFILRHSQRGQFAKGEIRISSLIDASSYDPVPVRPDDVKRRPPSQRDIRGGPPQQIIQGLKPRQPSAPPLSLSNTYPRAHSNNTCLRLCYYTRKLSHLAQSFVADVRSHSAIHINHGVWPGHLAEDQDRRQGRLRQALGMGG